MGCCLSAVWIWLLGTWCSSSGHLSSHSWVCTRRGAARLGHLLRHGWTSVSATGCASSCPRAFAQTALLTQVLCGQVEVPGRLAVQPTTLFSLHFPQAVQLQAPWSTCCVPAVGSGLRGQTAMLRVPDVHTTPHAHASAPWQHLRPREKRPANPRQVCGRRHQPQGSSQRGGEKPMLALGQDRTVQLGGLCCRRPALLSQKRKGPLSFLCSQGPRKMAELSFADPTSQVTMDSCPRSQPQWLLLSMGQSA